MLILAALAFAQNEPPLIDTLPPPPLAARCGGVAFPDDDAPPATVSAEAAAALEAHLFPADLDRTEKDRTGVRTDGVVVLHRGELVFERYADGWDRDKRHLAWSATKLFTNTLVGIAVQDGLLTVNDSVCAHLPLDGPACAVTVRNLLEMASGFDWRETYEGVSPTASSVLGMLYGEGRADMARFVAGHPLAHTPGERWYYSSGDTNLLSAVVGAAMEERGERYPWEALLDPIGMSATWERDGAGTYVGSSYLWATPRDLARFGTLWLNEGCWEGEALLPEDWVAKSTSVNPPFSDTIAAEGGDYEGPTYGWKAWLNRPATDGAARPWPTAPETTFAAMGHWGQSITVVPEEELVIVRVADDRDGSYKHAKTLELVLAMVEDR